MVDTQVLGTCALRRESSSLSIRTKNMGVAQLVEHRSPKPGVGSSSLSTYAKLKIKQR